MKHVTMPATTLTLCETSASTGLLIILQFHPCRPLMPLRHLTHHMTVLAAPLSLVVCRQFLHQDPIHICHQYQMTLCQNHRLQNLKTCLSDPQIPGHVAAYVFQNAPEIPRYDPSSEQTHPYLV